MKFFAICALMLLGAQSQSPGPRAGQRERRPPNEQTQAAQRQTEDVRGTEETPAVVRVLPIPKTPEEAAQEQADREREATANRWTLSLTGLTAVILIGQLIVYAIQAMRLRQTIEAMHRIAADQTRDMRASIAESNRAATAMEKAADASRVSADTAKTSADTALHNMQINVKAMRASRRSAYAAKMSAEIAEGSLELARQAERAWVSLEELDILRGETTSDRTIIIGLKNSGHSPAHIVAANVSFWAIEETNHGHYVSADAVKDLPDVPQYFERDFAFPTLLVAGEMSRWDYQVKHLTDHDFAVLTLVPGETRPLWVYGYVHYTDPLTPKVIRKYGWARKYDPIRSQQTKTFMWRYVNKPKYNYAD